MKASVRTFFLIFLLSAVPALAAHSQHSTSYSYSYSRTGDQEPQYYSSYTSSYNTFDYLCAKWIDEKCVKCAPRAFLKQNRCYAVSDLCLDYNRKTGQCTKCYDGYSLTPDGQCKIGNSYDNTRARNPLCIKWYGDKCIECPPMTFLNDDDGCQQVSPYCKTYSKENGDCLSCWDGYQQENGRCLTIKRQVSINQQSIYSRNPFCSSWRNGKCKQCAWRTYKNTDGICEKVSDSCDQYSEETGECFTCYPGFKLIRKKCIAPKVVTVDTSQSIYSLNPLCVKWRNRECIKCASRSYPREADGICVQIDPNCKEYKEKGGCTQCYRGYKLNENKCQLQAQVREVDPAPNNPYCAKFSRKDYRICQQCSYGSYMTKRGVCVLPEPSCKDFDKTNGLCQNCYLGYTLVNNVCINSKELERGQFYYSRPPQRYQYNQNRQKYQEKSYRYGCRSFVNGKCQVCEQDFQLFAGKCFKLRIFGSYAPYSQEIGTQPKYCLRWRNNKCEECLDGLKKIQENCYCPACPF